MTDLSTDSEKRASMDIEELCALAIEAAAEHCEELANRPAWGGVMWDAAESIRALQSPGPKREGDGG